MAALDHSALENVPTLVKAVEIADQAIELVLPIILDLQGKIYFEFIISFMMLVLTQNL
jgi:hypothetical protein